MPPHYIGDVRWKSRDETVRSKEVQFFNCPNRQKFAKPLPLSPCRIAFNLDLLLESSVLPKLPLTVAHSIKVVAFC